MTSTTLSRLRGFLICVPKPTSVRLFVDGEPHELKINSNHRGYTKLAETIEAMEGEQLQALDDKGNVLRAMRIDAAKSAGKRPSSDAVPLPPQLAVDPNAAMIMLFANLLHRAYKHSTQVAFSKMGELADRVIERMGDIETRLQREEAYTRRLQDEQTEDTIDHAQEIADLTAAAAAGTGDDALMGQLFQAWMSGRAQRQAANGAASNGAPNGAAKPAPGGKS